MLTSSTMPIAAIALNFSRSSQLVAQRVLHAKVERELDRFEIVVGEAAPCVAREALVVDLFLDARDALIVDVDGAEHVRGGGAARIEAPVLDAEADAGNAELVDRLLLARRDLALDPGEAALRRMLATSLASRSGSTAASSSVASSGSMM